MELKANAPSGPIAEKWSKHRFDMKLVNPANKRKYKVIVVGSGLAGGAGAASLAELGYNVTVFCYQDSPRRAHSIAAQGGINAAKNYQNDGDSVFRLFYDTVKGGDFRAREANVYRLAELSVNIIDQCVAQGVPFAREYGGTLANRSFGGALVSRTFYARGQTGQQLLLGAYQALMRQVGLGTVKLHPRHEMLELVVIDGRARGIVTRDMVTGALETHFADAVVLATGGYGNVFYLATYAKGCNATAIWRAHSKGAAFANPCYTQIHPTCIPVHGDYQSKLTLMSESLRNDGRIWVPKRQGDKRPPDQIPEDERDYYLERKYPTYGNLAPRDIASRAAKQVCDEGRGVGPGGLGVYLDFKDAIGRLGAAEDRREVRQPVRDVRAHHRRGPVQGPDAHLPGLALHDGRAVGRLQPDEHDPGAARAGEANFSDHGANRLGASALMQGLADGYFVLPYTVGHYLASTKLEKVDASHPEAKAALAVRRGAHEPAARDQGQRTVDVLPPRARQDHVGVLRHGPQQAGPRDGAPEDPGAARGVLEERQRAGQRRGAQPVARDGRPRRRLPRARRADVPGRARARGVLRRALPRGVPDARRRGAARRRALLPRGGLGVEGRGAEARAPRRAARVRERPPPDAELQVSASMNLTCTSGGRRTRAHRAASRPTRRRASAPTCPSSRCSTSSTRS